MHDWCLRACMQVLPGTPFARWTRRLAALPLAATPSAQTSSSLPRLLWQCCCCNCAKTIQPLCACGATECYTIGWLYFAQNSQLCLASELLELAVALPCPSIEHVLLVRYRFADDGELKRFVASQHEWGQRRLVALERRALPHRPAND